MKKLILSLTILFELSGLAQVFPEGIPFQAQVLGSSGNILSNIIVGVQFNVRTDSNTGPIVWQENHVVLLNNLGHFSTVVGSGTSTGVGTTLSFSAIQWGESSHFLEMLFDENNIGTFVSISSQQMMSVPFAYHAKTTSQEFALSQLQDVDTTGIQIGDVLKWNGTTWVPEQDNITTLNDSILFAYNSENSVYSDSSNFALNCIFPQLIDSSNYSYYADSTNYALLSNFSNYSDSANYAITAGVAQYSIGNWGINGNSGILASSNFLGTTDSVDLIFKTFGTEKGRIKANGRIGFGTANPTAGFHIANVDGVVYTGTHGTGTIPVQGIGSRMMWYPGKSAFRVGYASGTNWDNVFVGQYSFASGYNTRASGLYSVAFGLNTIASGEGSFAVGKGTIASGLYAFAAGENPEAKGNYSIALGRGAKAHGLSSIAIGYHPEVYSSYGLSLGNYTLVTGENGVAMGYHSRSIHDGSFIYADQSDPVGFTSTTAVNQFMVKASGGFIFYTNGTLTTGVKLAPGAGAWSILSDRNAKENIVELNPLDYLNKIENLEVFEWNYISQDSSIRHIGPMAQDFYSTFNLGTDSTTINSGDFDGVNLILIQALNMKMVELENQQEKIDTLNQELLFLREDREKMTALLLLLEQRVVATEERVDPTTHP